MAALTVLVGLTLGLTLPALATAPNPSLNLSHIECVDGQVEVHFVLNHSGDGGTPGSVQFGMPIGSAAPGPHTGDSWHFYAYYPDGTTFNLFYAWVNVPNTWPGPSVIFVGNSINDYNGTYDCSPEDPTATPAATPTETPVVTEPPIETEPPVDPTATPTETPVGTEPPVDPTITPVPQPECQAGIYYVFRYRTQDWVSWYWNGGECIIYTRGPAPSADRISDLCDCPAINYHYDGVLIDSGEVVIGCDGSVISAPDWLYHVDPGYAFGAEATFDDCEECIVE